MIVIHDGDHGGDDFVATLVALGRPDAIELVGVTTCHGNTSVAQVARNARVAVELAGRSDVPVCLGANGPWKRPRPGGDDAFGGNGLGGVEFAPPQEMPIQESALEWLSAYLISAQQPVTICVTGPMTNIADVLSRYPKCARMINRIVVMGGCVEPLGPSQRRGNITAHAEFNFYMDPEAADYVLRSGLPVTLLPMDLTHQLVFTPERRRRAIECWGDGIGSKLVEMLSAAESLDRKNFGLSGAVIHDLHTFLYLIDPQFYECTDAVIGVSNGADEGHCGSIVPAQSGPAIKLVRQLLDPENAFETMIEAVGSAIG